MTVPVSVSSNTTGLAFAIESALETLPGSGVVWYALEPNKYSNFGADYKSVARETINALRQKLKGTITDLTVKGGFSMDLTQHNLTRLLQGFFYALAIEKPATQPLNGTQVAITSVTTTQFLAASGLGAFLAGGLAFAKNFGQTANNGLMHITASAAGSLTAAPVSGTLAAEASPPATAQLETCGFRGASGDIEITTAGAYVELTSTVLDFTTLGLTLGEWMFIGGDNAANAFATCPSGYARVYSVTAHLIQFDLSTFVAVTDTGTGKLIDLYFGKVIMNGTTTGAIVRSTYQLERTLGNDGVGTQSEYLTGAIPDEFTINIPEANKIECDMTFECLNIENRTGTTGLKAGTRIGLPGEAAINTSSSVYSSRLAIVNPVLNQPPLYAYASAIKISIKNTVSPNKAIGVLGAFDASEGDFGVSGTATAYFATVGAVAAIAANDSVCLQTILAQLNQGIIFDIPQVTLGGGANKVEKDKPIMVDLKQDASKNPQGYTFLANFFEYLPTVAM